MYVINRTNQESVSQARVAVAEARGRFWNPEEGERPPLEAVSRRLVNTQQPEEVKVCILVNCNVCELEKRL
jgi:hypothetical protein